MFEHCITHQVSQNSRTNLQIPRRSSGSKTLTAKHDTIPETPETARNPNPMPQKPTGPTRPYSRTSRTITPRLPRRRPLHLQPGTLCFSEAILQNAAEGELPFLSQRGTFFCAFGQGVQGCERLGG